MGEAHPPIDCRGGAGEVGRRCRGDARFRDLRRHVDCQTPALAQPRCRDRRADATELDELERDPAGAATLMGLDIGERMDAFVGAERDG